MTKRHHLLAAALLLATPTLAADRVVFQVQHGHWTVASLGSSCTALNRPPEEFNYAPYNALWIKQRAGGDPIIAVHAWPGLFRQGEERKLTLSVQDALPVQLGGSTIDTYAVEARVPIPADLYRAIRDGRFMEVSIEGVSSKLAFDIRLLDTVLSTLQSCARMMPKP